jgi:hypothetical protein
VSSWSFTCRLNDVLETSPYDWFSDIIRRLCPIWWCSIPRGLPQPCLFALPSCSPISHIRLVLNPITEPAHLSSSLDCPECKVSARLARRSWKLQSTTSCSRVSMGQGVPRTFANYAEWLVRRSYHRSSARRSSVSIAISLASDVRLAVFRSVSSHNKDRPESIILAHDAEARCQSIRKVTEQPAMQFAIDRVRRRRRHSRALLAAVYHRHVNEITAIIGRQIKAGRDLERDARLTDLLRALIASDAPDATHHTSDQRPLVGKYLDMLPACDISFVELMLCQKVEGEPDHTWRMRYFGCHSAMIAKVTLDFVFNIGGLPYHKLGRFLHFCLNDMQQGLPAEPGCSFSMSFGLQRLKRMTTEKHSWITTDTFLHSLMKTLLGQIWNRRKSLGL